MTSKEALEVLETLADNIDYKDYSVSTQNLVNGCFKKLEKYIERLEKLKKAIEILKNIIILPIEDDISMVDNKGNNYYVLRYIKKLLSEQEYELLKEVLENDK
jgi:hypothetical protein